MLAVVEDQQQLLGAQELDDVLLERETLPRAGTERGHHDLRHRVRVAGRRQLAQPCAARRPRKHLGRDLNGEAGLADTTDADDGDEPDVAERVGDRVDLLLAADERRDLRGQVAREGVERLQSRELASEAGRAELEHALGASEVTETVLTEVDELVAVGERFAEQLLSGVRHDDLATVRGAHETRGAIQCGAVVVAVAQLGRSRVQAHPHQERNSVTPLFGSKLTLHDHCRGDRDFSGRERGVHTVTRRLDDGAAMRLDPIAQDLVVTRQR